MSLLKKTKTYQIFCVLACFIASLSSQAQVYLNQQIETGAETYIRDQVKLNEGTRIEINALPLDARLKSRKCSSPLLFSSNATPPFNRQVTVRVKCEGDNVTIYATTRTLTIKTTGVALQDGNIGEQIRVKNQKSGKTISARVKDVESVEVNI